MDLAEESGIALFTMPLSQTEASQLLENHGDVVALVRQLAERHDPRLRSARSAIESDQAFKRRLSNELLELFGFDVWYFMDIPFTIAEHRRWVAGRESLDATLNRIVLSRRPCDPRRIYVKRAAKEYAMIRVALSDEAHTDLFGSPFYT